jgi:hypothetical protein
VLLRSATCERSAEGLLPPLVQLRHVQIVTALEQAVRLDPDLEVAHHELAHLYGERKYFDQALEHRREEIRLSRRAGRRPGETAEEFASRLDLLEKDTAKLVELVEGLRKKYAAAARSLQGDRVAEAGMALNMGLGRQALDEILLSAPPDVLGGAGWKLELEMLLLLGRVQDVRRILGDKGVRAKKHVLGFYDLAVPQKQDGSALYALPYHWPAYEWLHALEGAAVGDYLQARGELRALSAELHAGEEQLRQQRRDIDNRIWAFLPGLLSGLPPFRSAFTAQAVARTLQEKPVLEAGERALRAQQADLHVLEGLLALEQGDPEAARVAFAEAQELCAPSAGGAFQFAGGPIAGGYLGDLKGKD